MIKSLSQSPRRLLWMSTAVVLLIQTILFTQAVSIHGFATGDGGVKLWQVQGILRTGDLNAPLAYPGAAPGRRLCWRTNTSIDRLAAAYAAYPTPPRTAVRMKRNASPPRSKRA